MNSGSQDDSQVIATSSGRGARVLGAIERVGNRLPHPLYLFLIMAALVAVGSTIAHAFGAQTMDPSTGEPRAVEGLLTADGAVYALTSMIENFVSFPPLGLIITVMLGIGLAERVGLLSAFMRGAVSSAPPWALTFVVVIVSIMGNLASDAAMVIIPPLAAVAFYVVGRHPLAGFAASYCAVIAGFSANFMIAGTDVLLAGITTSGAQIVDPEMTVTPLANWYFMAASTLVLAVAITLTCTRYLEPRLGSFTGHIDVDTEAPITREEKRGMSWAGAAMVSFIALVAAVVIPGGSPLRGEDGGVLQSPFMDSIPVLILFFFIIGAVTYGVVSGSLTSASEVPQHMADALKDLVPFIVVIFVAAQAIAWFDWSGLGMLVATSGAEALEAGNLDGMSGLVLFSIFVIIPNFFILSGSAQWALLAPIFVPMFMMVGIDPAYTQAAFRISDSAFNPLVPVNPMLPVVLGLMQRFAPKSGLGTLFSIVLPFTVVVWVVWMILFLIWGGFELPMGPGHELYLD